jgi:hypothetical protein
VSSELETLKIKYEALERELAACKKAKQENDERFMIERDEARKQNAELREALELIAGPSEFNCAIGESNMRAAARKALAKAEGRSE